MTRIIATIDGPALFASLRRCRTPPPVLAFQAFPRDVAPSDIETFPPNRTPLEARLKCLEDYVSLISRLAALNQFSTPWLAHPVSQKNDLEAYPLFDQIVDYLAFLQAWEQSDPERGLAVLSCHDALVANILEFARVQGIAIETPGWKPRRTGPFAGLRTAISAFRKEWEYAKRMKRRARAAHPFLKRIDKERPYSVLNSAFTPRSPREIETGRDVFLGRLPTFLMENGRQLLFYGSPPDKDAQYENVLEELKKISIFPILPSFALIERSDRWATLLFSLTLRFRLRIPDTVEFEGRDVAPVIRNYLPQKQAVEGARSNYIHYRANCRLIRDFRLDEVFTRFENKPGDQLFARAVQRFNPSIVIKAFQHAQVAQSSSRLFVGKEEADLLPWPDFIMTLGAYTRDYLVTKKNYPPDRVRVACALRHDRLPRPLDQRPRHGRLLVVLWNFRRSVELLKFLMQVNWKETGWIVRVRPHPTHSIRSIEKALGIAVRDVMEVSEGSFADDLSCSDIAIYSGTTACLDALAAGLPVVNVEFDDYISPDPLFQLEDFKWSVDTPDGLTVALREIQDLSDEDFMAQREKAEAFVREYFYPVTEENLRVFID